MPYPRSHGKSEKEPILETRSPDCWLSVYWAIFIHTTIPFEFLASPPPGHIKTPHTKAILPDTAIVSLIQAIEKIQSLCPSLEAKEWQIQREKKRKKEISKIRITMHFWKAYKSDWSYLCKNCNSNLWLFQSTENDPTIFNLCLKEYKTKVKLAFPCKIRMSDRHTSLDFYLWMFYLGLLHTITHL